MRQARMDYAGSLLLLGATLFSDQGAFYEYHGAKTKNADKCKVCVEDQQMREVKVVDWGIPSPLITPDGAYCLTGRN